MSIGQIPGESPPQQPPPQYPSQQQPGWGPYGPQPPRKRHRLRKWLLILTGVAAVFIALVVGVVIGLGSAANHAANPNSASKPPATAQPSSQPSTSAPAAPAPANPAAPAATTAPTQAAPATPAAPPADQIITRFSGTGMGTTGTFTVPADGNWHLSWAYTNGSLFAGQAENFVVYEYTTDGTLVDILVNALAIGNGTPTATPVYSDTAAGQAVYFKVSTEDASWELVPVTGTS